SDTLFAMLAGLAIMPAVFAFGISPQEGPGLVFIVLPRIFAQIPLGNYFAVMFFVILLIAAVTSVISLLEVVTAYVTERLKVKRKYAVGVIALLVTVCASFSSLSQGVLSDVKIFGKTIFDFFDYLSANILLPLGGLFIVLFVGWYMKKALVYDEFTNQGTLKGTLFRAYYFIIRYVAPVAIAIVFLDLILR
ncbi:MAG: sodium-dependent transporter, partial [Bacteroidales bacterium]|nr:sodium-dependent transporter [Bacteroidales bacterium]